jgi:glutathione S-transferase
MNWSLKMVFLLCSLCAATLSMQAESQEKIVYGVSLSPYVLKVLVAMEEKQLDYKNVEVFPLAVVRAKKQEPLAEFVQASPLGKIPAYREGDFTLSDSGVILSYLDRQYPEHSLYPANPKAFSKVYWFEKYGDETLGSITQGKILLQKIVMPQEFGIPTDEAVVQKAISQELPLVLAFIEKTLQGRKWICGDEFTAADIALGAQLNILDVCQVTVNQEKYPNIVRYKERLFARDSFKKFLVKK